MNFGRGCFRAGSALIYFIIGALLAYGAVMAFGAGNPILGVILLTASAVCVGMLYIFVVGMRG